MMAGYRAIYIIAIVCVGLAAVARSGLYYVLGVFVDDVLPSENMNQQLIWVILSLILLALLQGFFSYAGGRLAAKSSEGIARRLRNYLYDQLQRLTFSYHDRAQTGDLLARATSDVDAVRRMFAEQVIGIGRIVLLFVVNFVALLLLDVKLALFSVIVIPLIIVISIYFFVKVGKAYEAFQAQESRLSNQLQENLSGVRVVKAFARQAYEIDAFEKENAEKFQRGRKLTIMHSVYWPSTDLILGIQMVAGFYAAALMVMNGTMTVGMYVAYAGFLVQIIWPIRNLGRLIADISTGAVSFGRIQELIKVDQESLTAGTVQSSGQIKAASGRIQGALSFNDVSFHYEGEEDDVLHNISFTVQPGQKIALMGGAGSGKTSLVNLLPRYYDYTKGSVQLDGVELRDYAPDLLRQQIGIVMQEPYLFSTTIRENI
ncbi:MAG: ATP-binding cassette domain-containing protein, partial [Anaerolineae bacterium]|nr:ATP-binding cassette domain-containing protein [Anaerolineae bacterium]